MANNKMKLGRLLIILAATVLLGCTPSDKRSRPNTEFPPDPAVLAKLQELVNLRQRIFERTQEMIKAGVMPNDGTSEIKLAEARMELALEQHQREVALAELKKIVVIREDLLARAKARGPEFKSEVDELHVDLLSRNDAVGVDFSCGFSH
jgi:hypothetical protein